MNRIDTLHSLRSLSLLILAMLVTSPTVAQELLWSDEFDSGNQPNPDIWTYEIGTGQDGWGNQELQEYTNSEQNIKIIDGKLIITALPKMAGEDVIGFTSARIKTQDKLTFKYATIEARIKAPDLERGLWPAFWTLGNNFPEVGWPNCGELDIMEMGMFSAISSGAGRVNEQVSSAAHWESDGNYAIYSLTLDKRQNLTEDFHVLTMDWTPTLVTTYLDGEQIWAIDISSENCSDCEEFHAPHFALLNMAVGGTFTGMRSIGAITATLPANLEVDYVRIYDNGFTEVSGTALGAPDIGPAHSGSWYNEGQSGHGFSAEFSEIEGVGPLAAIYWYTFDNTGQPIFFLGTGTPDGNRVEVTFQSVTGMVYGDFDPGTVVRKDGGTGIFEFSDRDNATFTYKPSQYSIDTWGHSQGVTDLPLIKILGIAADFNFTQGSE